MNISIIVPNYNGEELLKRNLPRVIDVVLSYKRGNVEVIIVDDWSTDSSVDYIKSEIENIKNTYKKSNINLRLLVNSRNLGFSSTVNKGAKEAKGELIILLNTDVIPEKGFLDPLVKHFKDPKVFAVGCLDKSIEDGKVVLRGRGVGGWQKGFLTHARGNVDKTSTLWVSGGSGAFRKSIWEELGGFDELYNPFYWEDVDLSYRALKSGYKILFEPKSVVVHEHEKGSIRKKYSPSAIKTIAYRNQFIFVWKNATDLDLQFLHVLLLPYQLLKALIRKDWFFFIGLFEAFILLPKIIKSSFKAKMLFIKTDKEIVKEFLE